MVLFFSYAITIFIVKGNVVYQYDLSLLDYICLSLIYCLVSYAVTILFVKPKLMLKLCYIEY